MSMKEKTQEELAKLSRMSLKDKIWYIGEYYKFHILGVALIIGFFSLIGNILYNQTFTTRLSIAVINDRSGTLNQMDSFEAKLREELAYGEKDILEINQGLSASFDSQSASQYDYATLAKISALVAGQSLDVFIADEKALEHYCEAFAFLDLKEVLPDDLYALAEPYLFYGTNEAGAEIPVAISLADTDFSEETGIIMDPPYFAILSNSLHIEDSLHMLRYILEP